MSGVKDLVELKLQKKMLENQLTKNRKQAGALVEVLQMKSQSKDSTMFAGRPPLDSIIKVGDKTLHDLRPTEYHLKARPKPTRRNVEDIEPSPIPFGGNLERIRHQHIRRTVCQRVISKQTKLEETKEQKQKLKQDLKPATVKVPASMFPNRYTRGELPCIIEHGVKGFLSWVCPLENLDYDYYLPIFFDGMYICMILLIITGRAY
jgi:hypothetical protein